MCVFQGSGSSCSVYLEDNLDSRVLVIGVEGGECHGVGPRICEIHSLALVTSTGRWV